MESQNNSLKMSANDPKRTFSFIQIMKILILFLIILLAATSCDQQAVNHDKSVNNAVSMSTNLGDDEIHQAMIEELDKADISYQIEDNGFIHYDAKFNNIFQALLVKILNDRSPHSKKYGFGFADHINPVVFLAYLDREGFDTSSIVVSDNDNSVYWEKEDDIELQKHIEPFLIEYRKYQIKNKEVLKWNSIASVDKRLIAKHAQAYIRENSKKLNNVNLKLLEIKAGYRNGNKQLTASFYHDMSYVEDSETLIEAHNEHGMAMEHPVIDFDIVVVSFDDSGVPESFEILGEKYFGTKEDFEKEFKSQ